MPCVTECSCSTEGRKNELLCVPAPKELEARVANISTTEVIQLWWGLIQLSISDRFFIYWFRELMQKRKWFLPAVRRHSSRAKEGGAYHMNDFAYACCPKTWLNITVKIDRPKLLGKRSAGRHGNRRRWESPSHPCCQCWSRFERGDAGGCVTEAATVAPAAGTTPGYVKHHLLLQEGVLRRRKRKEVERLGYWVVEY